MAKTPPGDVFFASISELSTRLRAKEFSAVELTNAFCDRLEKIGGAHNALALSLRKSATKKAKAIADAGINMDFLVAQVIGRRYSAVIGFENEADSRKAAALIKRVTAKRK